MDRKAATSISGTLRRRVPEGVSSLAHATSRGHRLQARPDLSAVEVVLEAVHAASAEAPVVLAVVEDIALAAVVDTVSAAAMAVAAEDSLTGK
jgi:hypothetical protein